MTIPVRLAPAAASPAVRALGSLCSGGGGLDLAVEQFFGAETVWHAETDPAAAAVLAHRWPGVPNHGDLTTVDWATVAPVDIISAGWPCQPFSLAGKRKGASDERAIWPHIARAVRALRPGIVVLENVSAVLGPELTRVANCLAEIGYDLRWRCLRASDIGAAHRRERAFILAELSAHTSGQRRHQRQPEPARIIRGSDVVLGGHGSVALMPTTRASRGASSTQTSYVLAGSRSDVHRRHGEVLMPTPRQRDYKGACAVRAGRSDCDLPSALLPTPSAADGAGGHLNRSGERSGELLLPGVARGAATGALLPTPRTSDANGAGAHGDGGLDLRTAAAQTGWGRYESAIQRWECLTRRAPAPTEPNTRGNPRLSAAFSEWLMGWPAGWVTDPVIGLSRNDMLRVIGNGVLPQQAVAALDWLWSQSPPTATPQGPCIGADQTTTVFDERRSA